MAGLNDEGVQRLLEAKNHAVVSTHNDDGSIHGTVVWVNLLDGQVAVNSALGRKWPSNLQRDPHITVTVYDETNPYEYIEIRGTATSSTDGADAHIDALAKKYLGVDSYPMHTADETRVIFRVEPTLVRHQK